MLIIFLNNMVSNPVNLRWKADFGQKNGGVDRSRTDLGDFADRCLTVWLPRLVMRTVIYYTTVFAKNNFIYAFLDKKTEFCIKNK